MGRLTLSAPLRGDRRTEVPLGPAPHRKRPCALVFLLAAACAPGPYPHAAEPIGTVRQMYDGALTPELAVTTFRNIDRLFASRTVPRSKHPRALPPASAPLGDVTFTSGNETVTLDRYLELNRVTGLLVLADGRIALERYRHGNTARTRWMSMSIAKSITSTLIGAAVHQGKLALTDTVARHVPALRGSAYEAVTVRQLLTMTSGVRWSETYTDPASDRRRLLEAQVAQAPGGAMRVMASLPRAAPAGSVNTYSTGETQVAGEVLRGAVGVPLSDYLAERIWQRAGMEADATWWLESPDGVEIGGSGFSATLRDYARFGQFVLEDGVVRGERMVPEGWFREAGAPRTLPDGRVLAYGYFWWPVMTDAGRRDGAFEGEGIFGQHLYVNPAARLVIVVWSAQTHPTRGAAVSDWAFFDAVTAAVRTRAGGR